MARSRSQLIRRKRREDRIARRHAVKPRAHIANQPRTIQRFQPDRIDWRFQGERPEAFTQQPREMLRVAPAGGEPDFYFIGSRSYGSAPSFLLRTGLAQLETILDSLQR